MLLSFWNRQAPTEYIDVTDVLTVFGAKFEIFEADSSDGLGRRVPRFKGCHQNPNTKKLWRHKYKLHVYYRVVS